MEPKSKAIALFGQNGTCSFVMLVEKCKKEAVFGHNGNPIAFFRTLPKTTIKTGCFWELVNLRCWLKIWLKRSVFWP